VSTPARILDTSLAAFGSRGYEAVSLDALARDLGFRKQTILHHFGSKDALLDALIDRTAGELAAVLEHSFERATTDAERAAAVVKGVFRLGARRPELLGFVREISRLGPPATDRLRAALDALVDLVAERMDPDMARDLLLRSYAAVIGAATEFEVLRALGERPSARALLRRRDELLALLDVPSR
jgi:TetR/AcrR family transcriptional regulator